MTSGDQAGYAAFASESGLHAVLSPDQPLDATKILVHALGARTNNIRVSVLASEKGDRKRRRAESLGQVIAYQLECFSVDVSVELVLSADEVMPIRGVPTLKLEVGVPEVSGLDVGETHAGALVSRYGAVFLEHMGIPYAKVEGTPARVRPGVSEAENELIEASDPAGLVTMAALEHVRGVISSKRRDGGFGPLATELKSRWLASELRSRPEMLAADALARVDVVRGSSVGTDPFGDLSPAKGGFWGTSGDAQDFLLALGPRGSVLYGVSAAIDPAAVVRVAEVAACLGQELDGLRVALALSARSLATPYLRELAALARGGVALLGFSDPAAGPLAVEVVGNGY